MCGCGNGNCSWVIIILLILLCCGGCGNGDNGYTRNNDCGCGSCC